MAYGVLQVDVGYDVADLGGLVLNVIEVNGNTFTVTIATGTYFLRTSAAAATGDHAHVVTAYVSLVAAIETALNAGGAAASGWTVTFDAATKRVSMAHDGTGGVLSVQVTPTTNGGLIGLTAAKSGGTPATLTADRTPDYYIDSDVGYWASWDEYEAEPDALVDLETHDGTPHGIAPENAAQYVDLVVPNEPRAKVLTRHAAASDPFTWRDVVRHARNVEPLAIYDGTETHLVRLRAESARWRPRKLAEDYVGHYDVPLMTRLLGRL